MVEPYQASLKENDKKIEADFTIQHSTHDDDDANLNDIYVDKTHLDIVYLFVM